ncbi:hypothetical protein ACJRO7_020362 [Eucalyptus globulus]|uniref:Uncharacterized protein n=1 Tax=Eucalyptus globulus TaxID=34317 RepID=A0ABD3KT01_EUCGL
MSATSIYFDNAPSSLHPRLLHLRGVSTFTQTPIPLPLVHGHKLLHLDLAHQLFFHGLALTMPVTPKILPLLLSSPSHLAPNSLQASRMSTTSVCFGKVTIIFALCLLLA